MKHIFIIGSKGIPANYGGFETFVEKLTYTSNNNNIKYHISCLGDNDNEFEYNGARCFNVHTKNIGSARAVLYDIYSIEKCISYIKENNLENCIIYVLACRIGPFIRKYKKLMNRYNIKFFINPDGHEWKRSKWNFAIRQYWKISEKLMVKYSDRIICDSKGIEKYINSTYKKYNPKTKFIAYGSDLTRSLIDEDDKNLQDWYKKNKVMLKEYYLIVGRFVPENNYETMIREFMKSNSHKDLVIISNVEQNDFYERLLKSTNFDKDKRIKFVGTVYNQQLLKKIRENAYAYIHGHEVGGTNPSLLEALSSTDINILLDVNFNREVGEDGAIYFTKDKDNLSNVINKTDNMCKEEIKNLQYKAKERIKTNYTWDFITQEYENLFLNEDTI